MNKLNTTIILSLILMLSGCAANTDEAPSATTATTATTTVATTTTAATTTQATTTSAQTTAVTEQSEPAETTAVTTTTTATTTEPVIVVEDEKPEPEKPAESTTPDGKYELAATDLQNPDGTYTQDLGSCDTVSAPTFLAEVNDAWSSNNDRFDSGYYNGKQSNPSQIPYSQITLENAHEAFPYMGFTGQHPGYIEILPNDSPDIIAGKIWNNLVGNESLGTGRNYEGYGFGYMPEHVFSSEADYNAWVADQEAQKAAADAAAAISGENNPNGPGFSNEGVTQEDIDNSLALFESLGF